MLVCMHDNASTIFSSQINAMANKAAGKGYENENFYANIKFQFIGVENVHVMRNSLQKLVEGNVLYNVQVGLHEFLFGNIL